MMVLDIAEEGSGRFHIWGTQQEGRSVLVRVIDFQPYFYMAAPELPVGQTSICSVLDILMMALGLRIIRLAHVPHRGF